MRTVNLLTGAAQHRPTRAIVLHENDVSAYASVHPLRLDKGQWRTGPGTNLSRDAAIAALKKLLGLSHGREIIPEHVLYSDSGRTLWYRTARRAPAFFHTGNAAFDRDLQGKTALYPALLFLAVPNNLYAWALPDDSRPATDTKLYRAPVLNVYDDGRLCSGTAKLPIEIGLDISVFERAFYETTFTHSNYRAQLTSFPGGHDALWRELARPECKAFDRKWLAPAPLGSRRMRVSDALNLEASR